MPEPNATGNNPGSEGDPAKPESPAPPEGSREPESGEDWKKKYLEAKAAEERANKLAREVEARDAEIERLRSLTDPPPADREEPEEPFDDYGAVQAASRKPGAEGAWAREIIRSRQETAFVNKRSDDLAQLSAIRDPELRDAVAAKYVASKNNDPKNLLNPNVGFRDPNQARLEVEREQLAAKNKAHEDEQAKLKKELADAQARLAKLEGKPPNGAPSTFRRAVGAGEHADRMSSGDYLTEYNAHLDNGDRKSAEALRQRVLKKELTLED